MATEVSTNDHQVRRAEASSSGDQSRVSSRHDGDPLALAEEAQALIEHTTADVNVIVKSLDAIIESDTSQRIIRGILGAIREVYHWEIGAYFEPDPRREKLQFAVEDCSTDEFRTFLREQSPQSGEGTIGMAWERRVVAYVSDLQSDPIDQCTDPQAREAGIRGIVAFPIEIEGNLSGIVLLASKTPFTVSGTRLDALTTIARTASHKIAKLGQRQEMAHLGQMVANAPISLMRLDRDLRLRYVNEAGYATLRRLEPYLPVSMDKIIGQSVDIFHTNPERQRELLSDPKNLPHHETIQIGPEILDLRVAAIFDSDGNFSGPMLTWEIVTERHVQSIRENEMLADSNAVNFLLMRLVNASSSESAIRMALDTVKESFGWTYGAYWKLDQVQNKLVFAAESGTVDDEFRRATQEAEYQEGQGLSGQAWQRRELVVVEDLSTLTHCPRVIPAKKAGITFAIAIPIEIGGQVIGTMDFLTQGTEAPTESRLGVMRSIGRLLGSSLERIMQREQLDLSKQRLEREVNELLRVAEAAAQGDLTVEVTVQGDDDLGQLGKGLAKMIADLKAVIAQVVESTHQFAEGSHVIAESASYLSESSQDQAATIEEMSASIAQLSRAINEISGNAESARSQAEEGSQLAKQGGQAVEQAIEAMTLITRSSEQVSDITQVIGEIASQTNLLALNAAIEAARAGEHGLGFAVVADEVRKLAERSSAAAKEITSLIKESTRRIHDGARLSENAGQTLATIVQGAEQTAEGIAKIASATQEQSNSATQITKAIQDVSGITETNASSAEELSASAEQLGAQATTLKEAINGFKV